MLNFLFPNSQYQWHCSTTEWEMADKQSPTEYTASRDKSNPHWNELLEHVRESNHKLIKLANFHLGNDVMAQLTNENWLAKATSSIASACLEVTNATCVMMATIRSIILKNHCVQQINNPSDIDICHDVRTRTSNSKKNSLNKCWQQTEQKACCSTWKWHCPCQNWKMKLK